ncbi:MAG: class I SAM-dependent methyltransferase, partial [Deltaproteobacteria bacterium]|nr:class I SAM-dependent methyltransferase [Deltaproteobacteria bacterium]
MKGNAMNTDKILTHKLIAEHKDISGYLHVSRRVQGTIEGRACDVAAYPFLALLADLMRERFPHRFCYLEIGTLFGGSLCAVSFKQKKSEYEKYAGIDIFTYYGDKIDPSSDVEVSIEKTDRNTRYFGVKNFALFEGKSTDEKVGSRALSYLRGEINMLYIDGDHTAAGVKKDFETYSKFIAPGGIIVFGDYHNNDWPGVTETVAALDFTGWN